MREDAEGGSCIYEKTPWRGLILSVDEKPSGEGFEPCQTRPGRLVSLPLANRRSERNICLYRHLRTPLVGHLRQELRQTCHYVLGHSPRPC